MSIHISRNPGKGRGEVAKDNDRLNGFVFYQQEYEITGRGGEAKKITNVSGGGGKTPKRTLGDMWMNPWLNSITQEICQSNKCSIGQRLYTNVYLGNTGCPSSFARSWWCFILSMVVAGSGVEFIAGSRTGPASRNIRSALCIDAAAALAGIGT